VATVQFSAAAENDLLNIAEYTRQTWGEIQADRYLRAIEDCCLRLARNPRLGRACEEIRPGLRRMEEGRHAIFYRPEGAGILVSRILHQSMLPQERV
jgi:toxin ParE1/3/4